MVALAMFAAMSGCGSDSTQTPDTSVPDPMQDMVGSAQGVTPCVADPSWVTSPSLPTEIPNAGETLCDFYQFSWQSFLYLMSPSASDASLRNFEVVADYPILQSSNTCTDPSSDHQLFVRLVKDDDSDPEFAIPQSTGQAGGGATIYDQNGNVVYYSVLVSESMCAKALSSDPTSGNLPTNAVEMKLAWKVLDASETSEYVTIDATIGDDTSPTTLGLIGFHLTQSTASHPEMVWASYEHSNNASDCLSASGPPATGWDFQSAGCNDCLINPTAECLSSCSFNVAQDNVTTLTGPPTEICRLFPEGTDINNADNDGQTNPDGTTNNNGAQNISDVDSLNAQIVGSGGLISQYASGTALSVVSNYINIGAIWVTNIEIGTDSSNQRGSLQLENPVMETVFQGSLALGSSGELVAVSNPPDTNALNCFTCHDYEPGQTASSGLSHVYSGLIPASGE
jgi:hypothetical protein